MVKVHLTANLQNYYPQSKFEIEAKSIHDLLNRMDAVSKNFSSHIIDDSQCVRAHVNIYVDGKLLSKRDVQKKLKGGETVHIVQALSGG